MNVTKKQFHISCVSSFSMCHFENSRLASGLTEVSNKTAVDFGNSETGHSQTSLRHVTESYCKGSAT